MILVAEDPQVLRITSFGMNESVECCFTLDLVES